MKLAVLSSVVLLFFTSAALAQQEAIVDEVAVVSVAAEEAVAAVAVEQEEVPAFLVPTAEEGKGKGHGRRQRQCVRRFASSSSSSDSCDCCEECNKVYYDWLDFYTNSPNFDADNGTWAYYTLLNDADAPVFVADDGKLITGCSGGILDSKVYTSFQAGLSSWTVQDHAKWWGYAKTPIPVPSHGDVVIKYAANVQTFNTEENPFPSAIVERNDFRLASGNFLAFDFDTGLIVGYVVTNHRVYVLYQRVPQLEAPAALKAVTYAAFTFVVPVKIRRVCDWHDMEVVFHGDTREISFHLDDQEVFVINQVGFRLSRDYMVEDDGGNEELTWPETIQYGFGTFSGLDYYPSCQRAESCRTCRYPFIREALVQLNDGIQYTQYNPIFGPSTPAVFYDTASLEANKIWGQGTVTKIRKLIAYQRLPVC